MIWIIYAIAHSLFRAIFAEINRLYQIDAWQLTFVHAVCAILFLLPLVPFMNWPADPSFYSAAALVALIITVGIVIQLNLSSEQNGRTTGIAVPFEAMGAFAIWLAVDPGALEMYANDPLRLMGLGAAFVIAIFGLSMLRRHDINARTMSIMIPVAVTYAVAGVVTKVVVPFGTEEMIPAILSFVLVNYVVMTIAMGAVLLLKRRVDDTMRSPRTLQAGLITGMLGLMGYATFVTAVVMAPNPGYVSLTAVLVPVWLFIYHHAKHRNDHSSAAAALLVIISVVILVLSTM
ncbi:MAG: hypothetical protein KJ667_04710 [Alphaproteobacteria bacterium]|nr:hypothetical protein [Alphaproteobacteria bacterium]